METKEIIFQLYNKKEYKRRGWIADYFKSIYDKNFRKKYAITHTMKETRKN